MWALEIWGGEIQAVNSVVNPEKLAHLGPLADMRALLRASVAKGGGGGGGGGGEGEGDGDGEGGVTFSDAEPR